MNLPIFRAIGSCMLYFSTKASYVVFSFSTGLISAFGSVKAIAPLGMGSSLEINANLAFLSMNLLISQAEVLKNGLEKLIRITKNGRESNV